MRRLERLNPVFTAKQLARLANILDNVGQVILGIVVLSPIISGFDRVNVLVVLSGIVGVSVCWITSILLAREEDK